MKSGMCRFCTYHSSLKFAFLYRVIDMANENSPGSPILNDILTMRCAKNAIMSASKDKSKEHSMKYTAPRNTPTQQKE